MRMNLFKQPLIPEQGRKSGSSKLGLKRGQSTTTHHGLSPLQTTTPLESSLFLYKIL